MRHSFRLAIAFLGLLVLGSAAQAQTMLEKYLYSGELKEGEKALIAHLKENPKDEEVRLGLGVIQFFLTFEHFGHSLHKYGLRTEDSSTGFRFMMRRMLPQNRNPKTVGYKDVQKMFRKIADDLAKVDGTLAKVDTSKVKLAIRPALIKVKVWPTSDPVAAPLVMRAMGMDVQPQKVKGFMIKFDGGDVHWFRGYCHFLAAATDVILALDHKELFECAAHMVFDKVDTPHKFLLENRPAFDDNDVWRGRRVEPWFDAVAGFHLSLRFGIEKPKRMRSAIKHIDAMLGHAKEMWKHYAAEKDDDHEWIPNPKQTGVLRVKVTQDMIDTWLDVIGEAERVVQGKSLIPFWRGKNFKRGLNVRKVFMKPQTIDIVRWIQGTGATPYLEQGKLTTFADPRTLQRINRVFGGPGFFVGFAFWSN
ncbi:MAG: hypothetical protein ACFCD0_00555 [Gemmataceae bacterium]